MRLTSCLALSALLLLAGSAAAETLLVDRAQRAAHVALPERGLTTAQVQARYGAPSQRLDPRGGQKRQWPTINRWVYPQFTVYFERDRVIDAVLNQASATEVGPRPAIR